MRSFIYTRQRPFHPRRLWELVYDKFILQLEHPENGEDEEEDEEENDDEMEDDDQDDIEEGATKSIDDAASSHGKDSLSSSPRGSNSTAQTSPSPTLRAKKSFLEEKPDEDTEMLEMEDMFTPPNDVILENKRKHPILGRLFRSKGEFFLATRPHRAGDWSQAGGMLTMTGGRPWFCTLPPEDYTTGDPEVDGLVQHDIKKGGEWGDRRQELVFIGEKLDNESLSSMLDKCLLTDEEFGKWEKAMRVPEKTDDERQELLEDIFDDGFPDWEDDDHDDHEGHDHPPQGLRSIKKAFEEVS